MTNNISLAGFIAIIYTVKMDKTELQKICKSN